MTFAIPPYPAGIVQLLRDRSHTVAIRQNRHGSLRYRIDGGRELQAIEMDRWFARRYEGKADSQQGFERRQTATGYWAGIRSA